MNLPVIWQEQKGARRPRPGNPGCRTLWPDGEGVKVLQARLPDVMNEMLLALDAKHRVVAEKVAGG